MFNKYTNTIQYGKDSLQQTENVYMQERDSTPTLYHTYLAFDQTYLA